MRIISTNIFRSSAQTNNIPFSSTGSPLHNLYQFRSIAKVRLKWVKNRSLDHIIDTHTEIKAASLIKDAIARSSTAFLTSKSLLDAQKLLGLTVPTLRFVRRYPTLFEEYPHPKYPSLPCFKLTQLGQRLHDWETRVFNESEDHIVERLCRLLMMTRNKMLPLQAIHPLKWDLGLPDDFDRNLVRKFPDYFLVVKGTNGLNCLKLVQWREEYSVSMLQKMNEKGIRGGIDATSSDAVSGYGNYRRGKAALEFSMSFPRGYGAQKKVKAWMDEFQKLPYISPYEDSRSIDPNSELMEKRVVGVLHEFLWLTLYKKTKRNYLRSLREDLNLPHKFTRIFTRYPGIFYLSLKCKTTTVVLREGYRQGRLVDPHPLTRLRDKLQYVMRTGLVFRNKAADILTSLDHSFDNVDSYPREEEFEEEDIEEEFEEEDMEMTDECCVSEEEIGS